MADRNGLQIEAMRVVLTGASGGIGGALARRLASGGAQIFAVGRDGGRLQTLVDELNQRSGSAKHQGFCLDLSSSRERDRLTKALAALPEPPNVLINNAGINRLEWFERQEQAQIELLLETNLVAPLMLTRCLLPLLRRNPAARILNVGSTFGSIGYPGYAAYSASKFALRGFSEALERELAGSGVKVLYAAPRATRTSLNSDAACQLNEALGNRMDDPDAVAKALLRQLETAHARRYLGWPERFYVRLNALWPSLVTRSLASQLPTIRRFIRTDSVSGEVSGESQS